MSEGEPETQEGERGRLFLVTGPDSDRAATVARGLAGRLPRSIVVDGARIDAMVVTGGLDANADRLTRLRNDLLRWSACLAVAETYLLEGFDALVTDSVLGEQLDDFLDLAAPERVQVIGLGVGSGAPMPGADRWGLWLDDTEDRVDDLVDAILGRLEESIVITVDDPAAEP